MTRWGYWGNILDLTPGVYKAYWISYYNMTSTSSTITLKFSCDGAKIANKINSVRWVFSVNSRDLLPLNMDELSISPEDELANFPFLSSNIPTSPAYGVFISQLIRYARACSSYRCFIPRATRLSNKLLEQGYAKERLKSSLRKFYGRYGDLDKLY